MLIVDEAQESLTPVFNELHLASRELDSKQLLCVAFAGAAGLPDRRFAPPSLPLGWRIRGPLALDYAARDDLRRRLGLHRKARFWSPVCNLRPGGR